METNGVEALLASSVNNVYYFTGYYAFEGGYAGNEIGSLEAPYALKTVGRRATLVLGAFDEGFYEGENDRVFYGKSVGDSKDKIFTELQPVDALAQAISDAGIRGKVAVDPMFPLAMARRLQRKIPGVEFLSDTSVFETLRMVKTPEEISRVRKAIEILEYGNRVAYESLRPGMTEIDMVNEARAAMISRYKSIAADIEFGHMEVGAGLRSARGAGTYPTNYALQRRDVVHLDAGIRYKRYVADTCRDAVFQESTPEVEANHRVITKVLESTTAELRPGLTATEVFNFALSEIRKLGWSRFDSEMFGHSLGLSFHENPLIARKSEVRLEPNMVVNIEIPVSPPQLGAFNMEDTHIITESGAERISKTPHDLLILGNT